MTGSKFDKLNGSPGTEEDEDDFHHKKYLCFKISKQMVITAVWITMGMTILVVGPTIPDLRAIRGYSYEEISRGLAARSAGSFVGAVIGGVVNDLCPQHSELIVALAIITGSICSIFIPIVKSLPVLIFLMCIIGADFTIINTGGMPMVLDLWRDKASGPMHSTHFGFGLGAFIAPLIAGPFLAPPIDDEAYDTSSNTTAVTTGSSVSHNVSSGNGTAATTGFIDLYYPYCITSGISIAIALALLGFYMKGPPDGFPTRKPVRSLLKLINPSSCFPGRPAYSTVILILLFIYYIHAPAGEHVYGTFVFSYALERGVNFDKAKAAVLTSVYWGSHTAGRFSGILISQLFQPRWVITACLMTSLGVFICLAFLSQTSEYVLWILTPIMGFVTSLFFASGILWAQQYIIVNAMASMIFFVGTSVGMLIYLYITGFMFDAYGLQTFSYVLIFYIGCYMLIFLIMEVVVKVWGSSLPENVGESQVQKVEDVYNDEEIDTFLDKTDGDDERNVVALKNSAL